MPAEHRAVIGLHRVGGTGVLVVARAPADSGSVVARPPNRLIGGILITPKVVPHPILAEHDSAVVTEVIGDVRAGIAASGDFGAGSALDQPAAAARARVGPAGTAATLRSTACCIGAARGRCSA